VALVQAASGLLGLWWSAFGVSLYELVIGGADALEGLDQQNDHVGDAGLNRPVLGCFDYFGVD